MYISVSFLEARNLARENFEMLSNNNAFKYLQKKQWSFSFTFLPSSEKITSPPKLDYEGNNGCYWKYWIIIYVIKFFLESENKSKDDSDADKLIHHTTIKIVQMKTAQ